LNISYQIIISLNFFSTAHQVY